MFLLMLMFTACDSDDPEPVNEEEVITTVRVTFTNTSNASDVVTASFQDLDGEGGNAPTIDDITLSASSTYTLRVEFLNEQENPAEDITEEVQEENLDHQVFYLAGGGAEFTYSYGDEDDEGKPLGLTGTATTGAAGSGTLQVLLIHEPNKSGAGVSGGDPTNAAGESDVDVTFNLTIQ
ncbi:MAG: type 1 periplasmic binding fold superfamily protein [Cytophagia bacterium]|nr:type 1 periplasmic binding fold superfamily protein [Cytophagia bacterium]